MVPAEMENELIDAVLLVLRRHGRTKAQVRGYFASFDPGTRVTLARIAGRFALPLDSFLAEVATELSTATRARYVPEYRECREVLQ